MGAPDGPTDGLICGVPAGGISAAGGGLFGEAGAGKPQLGVCGAPAMWLRQSGTEPQGSDPQNVQRWVSFA